MAKKVNLKKVNIDGELTPVTLGYLNSRKKGPFLVIFIVGILIAVVYYMPQISDYIKSYLDPTYREEKNDVIVINDDGVIKELTANTKIIINNKTFSDFSLNNNTLTFKISDPNSLENYFIKTFNINKQLIETIPITSSGEVSITNSNVSYISISIIENYEETPATDDVLSCTKDNEVYDYTFKEDLLSTVTFKIEAVKTDMEEAAYEELYNKYLTESEEIKVEGITKAFTNITDGFSYTKTYDLETTTMTNVTDENAFSYKAEKELINTTMTNKGYECK